MANIGVLLKDEISRLCRKEIRKQVEPLRKASANYRREIADLKRQVANVGRTTKALAKPRAANAETAANAGERPIRFVAKGLRSLRDRLDLSAPELAQLLSVSSQSIYNWESKKSTPRKEQLAALVGLRALGKKEARARLDAIKPSPKKRATKK